MWKAKQCLEDSFLSRCHNQGNRMTVGPTSPKTRVQSVLWNTLSKDCVALKTTGKEENLSTIALFCSF